MRAIQHMRKGLMVLALVGAATVGFAPSAHATTVIDFGTGDAGIGGTVSIGANITGSNIFIDTVTITGAPSNNGTFDVTGTGACSDPDQTGCGLLNFDRNANTISIVGAIPTLGISSTTLLSGDLTGGVTVLVNGGVVGAIDASGNDHKAPSLLAALGLPANTAFTYFGFETAFNLNNTGSPYTAISTDITNTTVPEPGSLFLLGTGFVSLAGAARRRFGQKK